MFLKKYFLFLTILTQSLLIFSQNTDSKSFTLQWNDQSLIQLSKDKTVYLPLVENNFFDENKIPTSTHIFNVQSNVKVQDYQIKNVKFSVLAQSQLGAIAVKDIPVAIESEFKVTKIKERSVAVLQIKPMINDKGQIKKILSFTLDYVLGPDIVTDALKLKKAPVYAENSVLSTGSWYKFRVDTTGIFKIDRRLLQEIGVSTSGLDPKNIKIYGNGGKLLPQLNSDFRYDDLQENSIYIEGEEDGNFDENDYILFYAQGPHHWEVNTSQPELSRHRTNIYSDYAYYFITTDKGPGKRVQAYEEPLQPANIQISTFHDFLLHEMENVNLFANGQQWLGEDFSFEERQSFSFDFTDLDPSQSLTVRARAVAISANDTQMAFKINGQDLMRLNFNGLSLGSLTLASPQENTGSTDLNQEQIAVDIEFINGGNPSSRAYLDYIEIIGSKKLIARGQQFSFRNLDTNDPTQVYEYRIQNSMNISQLWDVTDPINPTVISNNSNGTEFTFRSMGGAIREFIVHGSEDYGIPESVDDNMVENQNLHQLKDLEYVIITRDELRSEADRLVNFHRANSGLNAEVIDLNQIYNEFGSGSPDLTAIRDFVRFLYLNASSPQKRVKYVCLFGDSSFDFKDRITDNNNIVPAFQSFESFNLVTSYVTDDYFGMMDDNEGLLGSADMQDVATGRFPVTTLTEARETIDKTLNYYASNSFGDWRNTVTFVADDPDEPNEFVLQQTVDLIAQEVEKKKPEFNLKKIYSDAYQQETSAGGELYPTVNEAINNAVETGTLVVDYFGHGGVNGWAGERILEVPQIQNWKNFNTLPLFITVTCEFARFDNPIRPTAGEYTFLNARGGAVNMISTSREIFISVGQVFNNTLIQNLFGFEGQDYTIAEALMYSKHSFGTTQRFFIYNFGDPAMKLAQARPNIKITKINENDLNTSRDTLKALSKIKLEGIITDQNDQQITDYNGTLTATIYDKALDKSTLDNDNFGRKMAFTAIESKIFRGRASVSNGAFSFDFIVPKDIRIAYGKAKISLYAENLATDKTGSDLSIVIGGIDTNAPEDSQGPDIRLFMNDESFVDGGNTSASPVLYAILEDISGINTSITAVDHDIIAILDDNNANPYVLNDYYETELNDYQKGKVKFPFRDLKPGLHTIKFKCWDTYNNPSESTLSFIVVNDNDLILSNVLNYPNPFINYTEFWFNHNKPNETLDVQVQIFTVSGKLIKTLNRSVQSEGLLSRDISWNGLDDFGNKIGKGVYVYKLHVRSQISNAKAEKFEKLVILQ
jgi:hypothetical protein